MCQIKCDNGKNVDKRIEVRHLVRFPRNRLPLPLPPPMVHLRSFLSQLEMALASGSRRWQHLNVNKPIFIFIFGNIFEGMWNK